MFLAIAVLLIHPQLAATNSSPAENLALHAPAAISASASASDVELPLGTATAFFDSAAQPAAESNEALPEAPAPMPALAPPAPMAFLKAGKPMTVSVAELRAENRRKQMMWRGLVIATSGAATFDAWTTRRAISMTGAMEMNPLLRPFAGNSSLYAAIQVAPALFDFAGKKMMYSKHSWVRRVWWVPQSASFVSSMFCGAHNLAFH